MHSYLGLRSLRSCFRTEVLVDAVVSFSFAFFVFFAFSLCFYASDYA
jgi:hypothetical protein